MLVVQSAAVAGLGTTAGAPTCQHNQHLVPGPCNRHLPPQCGAPSFCRSEAELSCLQCQLVYGRSCFVRLCRRFKHTHHRGGLHHSKSCSCTLYNFLQFSPFLLVRVPLTMYLRQCTFDNVPSNVVRLNHQATHSSSLFTHLTAKVHFAPSIP